MLKLPNFKLICRVTLVSAGLTKSNRVYFLLSRVFIFGRLLATKHRVRLIFLGLFWRGH